MKVNRQSLCRGKQGFVEVPELGFEIDMNNILSGILPLSTKQPRDGDIFHATHIIGGSQTEW